jgi:NTE family protein
VTNNSDVTLVCGGGGVWGVAWMTGLALGLADRGADLRTAGAFIGTSAGSVVSTQLASGLDLAHLFARQTDPAAQPREPLPAAGGMPGLTELMQRPYADAAERRQAMCAFALTADTIMPEQRRAAIVERLGLPGEVWPARKLGITAVDAETTELVVFDRDSGVSIYDAVAASCAVPGVWPPTPIRGRRYIDGGCWGTSDNLHLALGAKRVLLLSPMGAASPGGGLQADVERLRASGAEVVVVSPDEAAMAALAIGALDPASRKPAAEAGRRQAGLEAALAMLGVG